jgi:hypothetical protein
MSNPNEKRKAEIEKRAKKIGNRKVTGYLEDLFEKMDQMGPHAGVWIEGLESDWARFAKPQGLTHGFSDDDFADLHEALFGYRP